jgi:signal transduction protein with GAF and PtsI domain
MAADPMCTAVCMALGIQTLSMPFAAIPRIAWAIRRLKKSDADALLEECFSLASAEEIERAVSRAMKDALPELSLETEA